MVLFLNNDVQAQLITSKNAISALLNGLHQFANGNAIRRPRIDNFIPTHRKEEFLCFSSMEGGIREPGYYALRIKPDIRAWPVTNGVRRSVTYCSRPGLYGGLVFLFSGDNAELLAIMNDGYIQHLRVAAAAAIGVDSLAKKGSRVLGMIGSGGMSRSFADAFYAVRKLDEIKVYSPNHDHAETYAKEISDHLGIKVRVVSSAKDSVTGSDIVSTCTNSLQPVIRGEWLQPGMHVTSVNLAELGPDVDERIDVAGLFVKRKPVSIRGFVDDDFAFRFAVMSYAAGTREEREKIPMGTKDQHYKIETYPKARIVECIDKETGKVRHGRSSEEEISTIVGHSLGLIEGDAGASAGIQGIQFASIGGAMYEEAQRKGLGMELPTEMFLQNIRT